MKKQLLAAALLAAILPLAVGAKDKKARANDPSSEITQFNQSFGEAQVRRDAAKLDQLLSDDFTLVNPAGKVLNKSQFLSDMGSGELKYESLNYEDVVVRPYPDVAVVMGRVVRKGTFRGQDNSGQFRFIHVFVRNQKGWQVAVAQATRIAP